MILNKLVWKIGGEAGYGIQNAGVTFSKICKDLGLYVYSTTEYPSLIRGGHNSFTVRTSDEKISSGVSTVDLLVCLDEATLKAHKDELSESGAIIYNDEIDVSKHKIKKGVLLYPVPLNSLSNKYLLNKKVMMATIAIGASLNILKVTPSVAESIIARQLSSKSEQVIKDNFQALSEGFNSILKDGMFTINLKPSKKKDNILVDGNTAICLGAIRAGCKFVSSYPMTPATTIMEYMAKQGEKYNIVMHQAEDEIAAINCCLGASFAGVRSMTSTSGGGFALMNEAVSLAGSAEVPLVIVLGQRPGPATGLPTRTEQGDLLYSIYAGHGEFPKIVLAPGDVTESFKLTFDAFNLADEFQVPVIILNDKHLSASLEMTEPFSDLGFKINRGELLLEVKTVLAQKEKFKRYSITKSGISPRTIPGVINGIQCTLGDEHDEEGYIVEEPSDRLKMADKRSRKMKGIIIALKNKCVDIYGDKSAKTVIVSWGSNKGAILESLKSIKKCKFVHVKVFEPFPSEELIKKIGKCNKIVIVEQNATSQLGKLIKQNTNINITHKLLKYDGRSIEPEEIIEYFRRNKL